MAVDAERSAFAQAPRTTPYKEQTHLGVNMNTNFKTGKQKATEKWLTGPCGNGGVTSALPNPLASRPSLHPSPVPLGSAGGDGEFFLGSEEIVMAAPSPLQLGLSSLYAVLGCQAEQLSLWGAGESFCRDSLGRLGAAGGAACSGAPFRTGDTFPGPQ